MKTVELVRNWLLSEGFKSEIDKDGDLYFKYQGANLWITNDDRDSLFLRILMPQIYEVDNDREKVLEALNTVNEQLKAVKGFITQNVVCLSIEMYIDTTPDVNDFIERVLDILLAGRQKFIEEYRKL